MLEGLILVDAAYHRLRYLATLVGGAAERNVPPPHQFFKNGGGAWEGGGIASAAAAKDFLERHAGAAGSDAVSSLLGVSAESSASSDNPLLELLQARWYESIVRLANAGMVPSTPDICTQ